MSQLHFAALSPTDFDRAISALESEHQLGPFDRDVEDSWEYAISTLPDGIKLNITRTADAYTIATWLPAAPDGFNWQVVLSHSSDLPEHQISVVRQAIERVLAAELVPYHAA